jgi:hypothetical protein
MYSESHVQDEDRHGNREQLDISYDYDKNGAATERGL